MPSLTLDNANAIITGALAKAAELQLKPIVVSVFDAGGHLKAFQRQDGTSILRFEIASGKAFGALAVGTGSSTAETHYCPGAGYRLAHPGNAGFG